MPPTAAAETLDDFVESPDEKAISVRAALPTAVLDDDMSWTRLDDLWCEQTAFDDVPHDARWHYLCLIQHCSRNQRFDGRVPRGKALRCSDVDDPATAHAILAAARLVTIDGDAVVVTRIAEHVPPEYMRDDERKARQTENKRRSRLHQKGDHSTCLPDNCPRAVATDLDDGNFPVTSSPVLSSPGVTSDFSSDVIPQQATTGREVGTATERPLRADAYDD